MEDYKSNSYKSKAGLTDKKVEKVVKGPVKVKKKSEISKLKDAFISEDAATLKSFVVVDILIPALKKAVSDIVTNGIDIILYGESGRSKRNINSSNVSYRSYYDTRDDNYRYNVNKTATNYSYNDIIFETRGEAEEVLSRLDELIETYKIATVADLYDLVGITGNYTDNKYGWKNIRNAEVMHTRDGGYVLKLPKALPID